MKRILLALSVLFSVTGFSQNIKTVAGEYTFHAPENMTLEEAKQTALDRARIQALADEFGTIVSQTNTTHMQNSNNGGTDIDFFSIGGSEVKGEWLETIGKPVYDIKYEQGMLIVKVYVKGKAREIVSAQIDVRAHVLRNGTDDKCESDEFRNGDALYLSFVSPVKGYLAVYLIDDKRTAYCLLPYRESTEGIYKIQANRRYVFFHADQAQRHDCNIDEYVMTCSCGQEHNQIYVVFSPQAFAKAADNAHGELLPRDLPFEDFQKWLQNQRKRSKDLQYRVYPIKIIQ